MAEAPSAQAPMEGEENGSNQPIPEDGYSWKKYGQKFIKNTKSNRGYYKCQRCNAKKTVDWPSSDGSEVTVNYRGNHDHPPSGPRSSSPSTQNPSSSSSVAHTYNLLSQFLGASNNLC